MWNTQASVWNEAANSANTTTDVIDVPTTSHILRVLDEIDYGMMVLNAQGQILQVNHLGRHELASGRIIVSHGNTLMGRNTDATSQIQQALEHACRGQRRLLMLSQAERELPMVFIPLTHPLEADEPTVLVMLSRQRTSDNLAVGMYARAKNLSPSEESVLMGLCKGMSIPEIAEDHSVAESTVRSQIKALRFKTGVCSIRSLLEVVTSLPPVVPALRVILPVSHNAGRYSHP